MLRTRSLNPLIVLSSEKLLFASPEVRVSTCGRGEAARSLRACARRRHHSASSVPGAARDMWCLALPSTLRKFQTHLGAFSGRASARRCRRRLGPFSSQFSRATAAELRISSISKQLRQASAHCTRDHQAVPRAFLAPELETLTPNALNAASPVTADGPTGPPGCASAG